MKATLVVISLAVLASEGIVDSNRGMSSDPAREMSPKDPECRTCISWVDETHTFTDEECWYGTGWTCFSCNSELCPREDLWNGPCPSHHQWCAATDEEDIATLQSAIAEGDAVTILEYLRDETSGVRLNDERALIQLVNCQEQVIGQMPLPSSLLDALAAPRPSS